MGSSRSKKQIYKQPPVPTRFPLRFFFFNRPSIAYRKQRFSVHRHRAWPVELLKCHEQKNASLKLLHDYVVLLSWASIIGGSSDRANECLPSHVSGEMLS